MKNATATSQGSKRLLLTESAGWASDGFVMSACFPIIGTVIQTLLFHLIDVKRFCSCRH
jgi:hypothetical protein